MDWAVTKQLGSTWPSSPQIFAAKKDQVNFNMDVADGAERQSKDWLIKNCSSNPPESAGSD